MTVTARYLLKYDTLVVLLDRHTDERLLFGLFSEKRKGISILKVKISL